MMNTKQNSLLLALIFCLCNTIYPQQLEKYAMYPFEGQDVPETILISFSNKIESRLLMSNQIRLITRAEIDKVIQEQGLHLTCSEAECALELGKLFHADILIGKISRIDVDLYQVDLKIIDEGSGEIRVSTSETIKGDIANLINKGTVKLANLLLGELNPTMLAVIGEPYGAIVKLDGAIIGMLPMNDFPVPPGEHKMTVEMGGYEEYTRAEYFHFGQEPERTVILKKKTSGKAFLRSLIFPGSGQKYSGDENHQDRYRMAKLFQFTAYGCLAGIAYVANDYLQSKSEYDDAFDNYLIQTSLADINQQKLVTQDKHDLMTQKESLAMIVAGAAGVFWVGSAVEAWLRFPKYDYFSGSDVPLNLTLRPSNGIMSPTLQLTLEF